MLRLARYASLIALALAPFGSATGQSVPNLTGTWVLSADKSDFGQMPAPQGRSDVIDHKEPALTIKRSIQGPDASSSAMLELKYVVDGKPHVNSTPQGDITSTLKWEGNVLVVTSLVPTPNGEAGIVDRMSLSADGKTLTQDRTISIQGQELKQTMVLVKQ